jgi:GntR family transcriptional regulator
MGPRRKFDTKHFDLKINLKSAIPIYEQIKDAVKIAIFSNKLNDNDKLISIRDISNRFNINPITIMKAYNQLETEGLLYSRRGSGYFVKVDKNKIEKGKSEIFQKEVNTFLKKIASLGYTPKELISIIKKIMEKKND